ncbi:hypothetical protein B0T10DRAFT_88746 [Thelonectria olida]|uniref:Secreted protein n=1 Tax=Thelonectria olida TaxID=1576542 RepID=A0A9P9AQD0_9HYPO|nr:hypothetical protein B0T10DRAFT_88746 [Thelonectria olida]
MWRCLWCWVGYIQVGTLWWMGCHTVNGRQRTFPGQGEIGNKRVCVFKENESPNEDGPFWEQEERRSWRVLLMLARAGGGMTMFQQLSSFLSSSSSFLSSSSSSFLSSSSSFLSSSSSSSLPLMKHFTVNYSEKRRRVVSRLS